YNVCYNQSICDFWTHIKNVPINGTNLPKFSWNEDHIMRYLLNFRPRNFIMCVLIEIEYEKVHNCKSSKDMWDTLALAYEGKRLKDKYTLPIYNKLSKIFTYDLKSCKWRPQLIALKAFKELKKLCIEELLGTLKFLKKNDLMKTNSLSSQGRSTMCRRRKEDSNGRTT
ncbi:hypothetical protein CR513_36726, partial [Mucuna pruriens]